MDSGSALGLYALRKQRSTKAQEGTGLITTAARVDVFRALLFKAAVSILLLRSALIGSHLVLLAVYGSDFVFVYEYNQRRKFTAD